MAKFQSYMLRTGAPLTNDTAPTSVEPAAANVFTADSSQSSILVQLLDGTSATATVWSHNGAAWVSGATGTVGTTVPLSLAVTASQRTFVALTAVTGAPTGCAVFPADALIDLLLAIASKGGLEVDRVGSLEVNASLKDWRPCPQLAVNTIPAALDPGPCDAIKVDLECAEVFVQPAEAPLVVTDGGFDDPTKWTQGAGCEVTGGAAVWTNAAADLTQSTRCQVGEPCLLIFEVTSFTDGGVTPYIGTAAGTKRTALGVYSEAIVCAGSGTLKFTTDAASDLAIDNVTILESTGPLGANVWQPCACSYIGSVCTLSGGVATLRPAARVHVGFYRCQP